MAEETELRLDPVDLPRLLAAPAPRLLPPDAADRRAAVTLLLSPEPEFPDQVEALFALRAEVEGDPWSGHAALPGGREDPGDADLVETALRELREETSIDLPRPAIVGRLDDLHPRAAHLPSIAVSPFVAWLDERPVVDENYELAGHVWVPLTDLAASERRSSFVRRDPRPRRFEAIDYAGARIWGLTLAIVDDFLRRIGCPVRPANPDGVSVSPDRDAAGGGP